MFMLGMLRWYGHSTLNWWHSWTKCLLGNWENVSPGEYMCHVQYSVFWQLGNEKNLKYLCLEIELSNETQHQSSLYWSWWNIFSYTTDVPFLPRHHMIICHVGLVLWPGLQPTTWSSTSNNWWGMLTATTLCTHGIWYEKWSLWLISHRLWYPKHPHYVLIPLAILWPYLLFWSLWYFAYYYL